MNQRIPVLIALGLALGGFLATSSAEAAVQTWKVSDGTITLSLAPSHLANLGLKIAEERTTARPAPGCDLMMEPPLHAFRMSPGFEFSFRSDNGGFAGLLDEKVVIPFEGGFAFQTSHPLTKAALTPAFLFDFAIEIDPSREGDFVRVVSKDPSLPVPFEVQSTAWRFAWNTGALTLRMGDLVISEDWARVLEQPYLAGQWVGVFDLHLASVPERGEAIAPEWQEEEGGPGSTAVLDVMLGQLYGITSQGHDGTFPTGRAGLSAATTSCNSGQIRVPWNAPMAETHPFIGLALFRLDSNGILEMIGKNWMKHGFLALSNDQCSLGCEGCGGNQLCIGCSDTYSAGNNGTRFYLGPRAEVNPLTGAWEACGSFFDEPVTPDADCDRNYFGTEPNEVNHRLEVWDEDLANPGALYYYEGEYVVADDAKLRNNIGWRRCTMSWSGSNWNFSTVGGGVAPQPDAFVFTWGDFRVEKQLADDDGNVVVADKIIDLGGGMFHYEYVVYNWYSERGVRSFSVPIEQVNISNVSFHDVDKNAANNWTVTNDGSTLTWSTDDYASNPDANAVFYQTMFNFRFDADAPPATQAVALGIYKPGIGSTLFLDVQTPKNPAVSVLAGLESFEDFSLLGNEPNPFSDATEVRFSLAKSRDVRLSVLDISGRLVQLLAEGSAPVGVTTVPWDGRDTSGNRVASGVYFFRLESGEEARTVKGTFLR